MSVKSILYTTFFRCRLECSVLSTIDTDIIQHPNKDITSWWLFCRLRAK